MKEKFLKTTDSTTSENLKKLGFQVVNESNGMYIFLNTDKLQFSNIDKSKIQYSNILTFQPLFYSTEWYFYTYF